MATGSLVGIGELRPVAQVVVQAVGYLVDKGMVDGCSGVTWGVIGQIVDEIAQQVVERVASPATSGFTNSAITRGMLRAAR
jgi:hypothetical protein